MMIALFGSIEVAAKTLEILITKFPIEHIVVVSNHSYQNNRVIELCEFHTIQCYRNPEELAESKINFDYGFTIRYDRILRKDIINRFKCGIINFHGGPLPQYRGSATHIFALLNKEHEFGITLHFINEKVDEGKIIVVKKFIIEGSENGYSLLNKSMQVGSAILNEIIDKISQGFEIKGYPQDLSKGKTYKVKDLESYKKINLDNISEDDLLLRLRAFYHPEKESIYTFINGNKVNLKLSIDD